MPTATTTVVNLTLPIAPYGAVGSTFPWEAPYWTEPIATLEHNGANLSYLNIGSGPGTRLRAPSFGTDDAAPTHGVDLTAIVNRRAVVLNVPKSEGEAITAVEIASAFSRSGDWRGHAVVIATAWGDGERWRELGERYALKSPYFTPEAAERTRTEMQSRGSELLLTDCAHIDRIGAEYAREEWASEVPWRRPAWPSEQAKIYLRHYTREKVQADWAASLALTRGLWVVAGLVNCAALANRTADLSILPMFVQDVAETPCTVVAEIAEINEESSHAER